jgi:hypothetical protein
LRATIASRVSGKHKRYLWRVMKRWTWRVDNAKSTKKWYQPICAVENSIDGNNKKDIPVNMNNLASDSHEPLPHSFYSSGLQKEGINI